MYLRIVFGAFEIFLGKSRLQAFPGRFQTIFGFPPQPRLLGKIPSSGFSMPHLPDLILSKWVTCTGRARDRGRRGRILAFPFACDICLFRKVSIVVIHVIDRKFFG